MPITPFSRPLPDGEGVIFLSSQRYEPGAWGRAHTETRPCRRGRFKGGPVHGHEPVYVRVGHRRPSRQGRRPDLRRHPRCDPGQGPARTRACETVITTGLVIVVGEITTDCYVDIP